MQIYKDKCPFCGTYISISDASICPGCRERIYYGPTDDLNNSTYYYWPDKFQRDQAFRSRENLRAAKRAFDESPDGIEYARKQADEYRVRREENENRVNLKKNQESIGAVLLISVPLIWFFGGYSWDMFGLFGWPAFGLGIFFIWLSNRID